MLKMLIIKTHSLSILWMLKLMVNDWVLSVKPLPLFWTISLSSQRQLARLKNKKTTRYLRIPT
uniref:Uncharacterized protein n=1 Tax=Phlebia radiata TaxID=5308 RepID=L8B9I6_PHLRA|nr:hypothetical protein Pra_mt0322 [Phlebia radiata]CCF07390.1 hypothetical protein Pra_mt0322 [Phlebia radiata]